MRPWLVPLGVLVLLFAWFGSLGAVVPPFSAHMTLHMAVVAVAAPLIALGVAGGRWDPVRRWPALFPALIASMVELVLVWGWHAPLLHQAARRSLVAFVLEQASFLLSGLWLWLAAFGGGPAPEERRGFGVLALLLTSMHMTLLGALLALPPRALYTHGAAHAHHLDDATAQVSSLSALDDQHLGGAIMIVLGGASYLLGALWLCFALLGRSGPEERGAGR